MMFYIELADVPISLWNLESIYNSYKEITRSRTQSLTIYEVSICSTKNILGEKTSLEMEKLVKEFIFILENLNNFNTETIYLERGISIYYYLQKLKVFLENGGDLNLVKQRILEENINVEMLTDFQNDFLCYILDDLGGNSNRLNG